MKKATRYGIAIGTLVGLWTAWISWPSDTPTTSLMVIRASSQILGSTTFVGFVGYFVGRRQRA